MTCQCDICGYTNEVQEVGNRLVCDRRMKWIIKS